MNLNADFWLSKLYFHWIVREQGALQWFSQTLQDVSALDPCNLCDVHIHYTPAGPPGLGNLLLRVSALSTPVSGQRTELLTTRKPSFSPLLPRVLRSAQLAQEVERQQSNTCLLSGTHIKAKTSFGRWASRSRPQLTCWWTTSRMSCPHLACVLVRRPNVPSIVSSVAQAHRDARVGVLYCGAEELGAQLHKAIRQCGHPHMHLHREVF